MNKCRILLFLVLCAFAGAPSLANAADKYAAFAFSPSTGAYGYANGYSSAAAAVQRARQECGYGDAVTKWARNAWIALAVSSDRGYGWAWATSASQARAAAVENCLENNDDARVVLCVSASR